MIFTNDAIAYKTCGESVVHGYNAFLRGEYKEATAIFNQQASNVEMLFSQGIRDYEVLKRTQARCCEAMGNEDAISEYYNGHISFCKEYIGWLQQSIDDAMDTYAYRYNKVLELWDENKGETPHSIEYVLAHTNERNDTLYPEDEFVVTGPCPPDPFEKFPNEVAKNVLRYMPTSTLCAALRVSHHWNDLVMGLSDYLTNPTFVSDVAVPEMLEYTRMCKNAGVTQVSSMTISGLSAYQEMPLLKTIGESGLDVKSLVITIPGSRLERRGHTSSVQSDLSVENLHVTITHYDDDPRGEFLRCFSHLRNLSLTIEVDDSHSYEDFENAIRFEDLESFEFAVVHKGKQSFCLERAVSEFVAKCPLGKTKRFVLKDFPLKSDDLSILLERISPKSLSIERGIMKVPDILTTIAKVGLTPKCLEFNGPKLMKVKEDNLPVLSKLEKVRFSYTDLDEILMEFLKATDENMKELTLKYAVNISSGFSFSNVFRVCPYLQTLAVEDDDGEVFDDEFCALLGQGLTFANPRRLKTLRLYSPTISLSGIKSLFKVWSPSNLVIEASGGVLSLDVREYIDGKGLEYKIV